MDVDKVIALRTDQVPLRETKGNFPGLGKKILFKEIYFSQSPK